MSLVTFDFDDTITLTRPEYDDDGNLDSVQVVGTNRAVVKELLGAVRAGHEVRVVTSRMSLWEPKTLRDLRRFGLLPLLAGVHHTDGEYKGDWMSARNMFPLVHFDDNKSELENLHPTTRGVLVTPPLWRKP